MNVTGVDFVCVPTQNWEQSKEFYGDTLGLERSKQWGSMPARVWDTDTWVADSRKIRTDLGWAPRYTFEAGFRQMVAWLDEHPELKDRYEAAWR